MKWNLYEDGKFLDPLCFSNGKTQEDIVKEVIQEIKNGEKMIFIKGVCGTGKSAIALNLAKEIGKTSIVVPGKNLQTQYKLDYEKNKYLLKNNKEKLKISIITGRNNHKCKFLEENENALQKIKKEINLNLHDIFAKKREESKKLLEENKSADNLKIPCKIEIKEKNWEKIRQYLNQNSNVNIQDFSSIKDVKRLSIAPVCPYWSPVLLAKYESHLSNVTKKETYTGVDGKERTFYYRNPGCSFYEQFKSYVNSDVIVFNSLKYKLETVLGRKPQTEIEIIDECDEFLDSFSNQKSINLDRLQNALVYYSPPQEYVHKLEEAFELIKAIKKDKRIEKLVENKNIISLKETSLYDLLKLFLERKWIADVDDESYILEIAETAYEFENFLDESYLTAHKIERDFIINIVTTNLAKRFEELIKMNKNFVLMSGTIHSEEVLKNIFGLKKFKIIEAETKNQGKIEVKKTGLEKDCKYSNFSNGIHSRENYLKALDKCLEISKGQTLVHVHAFQDLPTSEEIINYKLKNLISREKIKETQEEDKEGNLIQEFKEGRSSILFSTRDSRGIDFPGDQCRSIVFTKYPNPNISDSFWKILNKTKPQEYWMFYKDKAQRELLQKLYRGLRFKEDYVFVLSPDSRVLDFFEKNF
ncbi:MAG: helicase C-terminal domain-containing protein [Candidatus Pacearchaeota archaeon]|jgi:Rad3-related DNA helicase